MSQSLLFWRWVLKVAAVCVLHVRGVAVDRLGLNFHRGCFRRTRRRERHDRPRRRRVRRAGCGLSCTTGLDGTSRGRKRPSGHGIGIRLGNLRGSTAPSHSVGGSAALAVSDRDCPRHLPSGIRPCARHQAADNRRLGEQDSTSRLVECDSVTGSPRSETWTRNRDRLGPHDRRSVRSRTHGPTDELADINSTPSSMLRIPKSKPHTFLTQGRQRNFHIPGGRTSF